MKYILATDVGSTTTKARFFEKKKEGWRFTAAGESPTTVEAPYEDVTMGVCNCVREVEELTGHKILSREPRGIMLPFDGDSGVDLYCTTSSAGGGLQMMVAGVITSMTAESANRAALGAGAIVMDIIAVDDGRPDYQKIQRIRTLRPDMILMAGGTDGGTIKHVVDIAELIKASEPTPRLGIDYKLPMVYAGNKNAAPHIQELFKKLALTIVDNIRPTLEVEKIEPARKEIHELFMEHVMAHAPGYLNLMKWTDVDIMPTPAGEGLAVQLIAKVYNKNTLGVGLGGATTNIYSILESYYPGYEGDRHGFVRSVSANLGMSYSICNVLKEAGIDNIMRWLFIPLDKDDLRNRLRNKMIRPTTIPQTTEELIIEQAAAREALRLGLRHHRTIATRLKGAMIKRDMTSAIFDQELEETYVDMKDIDIIVGTGGLLSHAPRRVQSLLILTDAWQPEGVTWLFQDSVFMMPHLGVLATVHPEAAWQIFDKDCLIRLGTVIAPTGLAKDGEEILDIEMEMPDGSSVKETVEFGAIKRIMLPEREKTKATISVRRGFTIGPEGQRRIEADLIGGIVGIVIDARGRPLTFPKDDSERIGKLVEWAKSLDLYPESIYQTVKE
ncbi:MAG: glutamate mutase L [Candidatus Bathyarchaeota archaeon]|nr:MAG: glutamate mutase L [Candidatus Bathyarchaeota archaeon]